MEPAHWFVAAIGFACATSASPGPNNTLVAAAAANFGLRRSLPQIAGVALGFPAMLVLLAWGVAEPLRASAGLQGALRWIGAAWLLWLAWRLATSTPHADGSGGRARPMTLLEAALFQWANPKAWIIAASAIATFTGSRAGIVGDAALLGLIFVVAAAASLFGWAAIGLGAARLLATSGRLAWFNRAMGVLLAASVVPMLLT